jgi:Xaa-Pro aminopeptidase
MKKEINELRKKFIKYNIDGYVVPKNDDYFTEYSKINRLKIISNFSGSAGLAIILKNKNYLFTDGRYTIQSEIESGKYFKIVSYDKIINCNLFRNLRLGLDPKLFTHQQIKDYFLKNNQIKFLSNNLIDEIKNHKVVKSIPFFSLKDEIVGESRKSKVNKIVNYLKKNKADNLFVTAPENVAWILNIRGGDGPNSPVPNSRLIITKSKKIFLITEPYKVKKLIKEKIINKNKLISTNDLPEKILALSGKNFIIDNKSCSVFYENIIKSKFKIIKREDPTYLLKAIKNNAEIENTISSHVIDGVALTKFIYWIKKVNKKKLQKLMPK